jgi:F-type H+-transporting ATPase subunit delta
VVNRTLARRYAVAIASLAREQDAVDRVSADLRSLARVISAPGLIRDFFESPVIDRPSKERVFAQAFGANVHPIALHALLLLVRKRREVLLSAIVGEYLALERAAHGMETLTLQSARPLERDEYRDLIAKLESLYRKKFEVTEIVDTSLIGGVRIMMGDRRIDATVSGALNALARELAQTT